MTYNVFGGTLSLTQSINPCFPRCIVCCLCQIIGELCILIVLPTYFLVLSPISSFAVVLTAVYFALLIDCAC